MFEFKVKCPDCGESVALGKGAHLVKQCKACGSKKLGKKVDKILEARGEFLDGLAESIGQALKSVYKAEYGKETSNKYADEFYADVSTIMSNIRGYRFTNVIKTATGKAPVLPEVKSRKKEDD